VDVHRRVVSFRWRATSARNRAVGRGG
jgi:hypothetical protein